MAKISLSGTPNALGEFDRRLRYFLHIAEWGSVSKAAEHLRISQPSLSRQIALLEDGIGQPVFERTGRGMVLSEAGRALHRALAPAFQLIDDTLCKARAASAWTSSSLKIATVHSLTYYFVGNLVSTITTERGDAHLHLMARSSPEVVDLVATGKADLGFVYDTAVANPGLVSVGLFDDEMCLLARLDDTRFGESINPWIEPQRLVAFPEHYALRKMLHYAGLNFMIAAETETVDSALQLVAAGVGNCLLPTRMPEKLLRDHRLRKVAIHGGVLVRKVVAIYREGCVLSSLAAWTLDKAERLCSTE